MRTSQTSSSETIGKGSIASNRRPYEPNRRGIRTYFAAMCPQNVRSRYRPRYFPDSFGRGIVGSSLLEIGSKWVNPMPNYATRAKSLRDCYLVTHPNDSRNSPLHPGSGV